MADQREAEPEDVHHVVVVEEVPHQHIHPVEEPRHIGWEPGHVVEELDHDKVHRTDPRDCAEPDWHGVCSYQDAHIDHQLVEVRQEQLACLQEQLQQVHHFELHKLKRQGLRSAQSTAPRVFDQHSK